MNTQEDNFKFFAPIHISKGKDGKGATVMKMKGVASTSTEDSDKESLDPNGFDLKYFLDHGYMNWNHQTNKNPLSIIGRPTSAKINKGKMEIECELFDYNPLAKDVYKLAEILEKQGSGLGYSIEGKVLERDKKDKSKVLKAQITGCAITPNPKNTDAVAKIVKGIDDGEMDIIKGIYSAYENTTDDEQEKAMSAGSESGQALSKESVDKDLKSSMEKSTKKKFNKGEIIERLIKSHPNNTAGQIEKIYTVIETIEKREQMSKQEVDISEDSISTAYEVLGISKGEDSTPVVKSPEGEVESPETETPEAEAEAPESSSDDEVEKGNDAPEVDDVMILKGESYKIDGEFFTKGDSKFKFESGAMVLQEVEAIEKAVSSEETIVGKEEDSSESLMKGITDLIKGEFAEQSSSNEAKFKAVATLNKGLSNQLEEALGRIEKIENTPNPSKSRTRNYIEKSFDNDIQNQEGSEKRLSSSLHKGHILAILDKKSGLDTGDIIDQRLAQDTAAYGRSNGVVTPSIQKALSDEGITLMK